MKKIRFYLSRILLLIPIIIGIFSLSSCDNNEDKRLKSYKLCEQLNSYLDQIKNDGTLQELENNWFGNDESKKVIDRNLSGENGKITFACSLQSQPMGYYKDNQEAGLSTDIIYHFAKANGYSLEFYNSDNTNTTVAAVLTGKADFGGTYMSITEERRLSGCFSDPYFDNKVMVMVTNETATSISSLEDLNGETFGCCQGSTYAGYITEKTGGSSLSEYATEMDVLTDLSLGRIKAAVLDKAVAEFVYNNNRFPNLCLYSQFYDCADQYGFFFPKFAEQSSSYYADKKIGTVTGSVDETFIRNKYPNAEICYYETLIDCSAALAANKIDAYADETPSFIYNKANNPGNLYRVPGNLGDCQYGFLFPKNSNGQKGCTDFNVFLDSLRTSGKLKQLADKWLYHYETAEPEIDYTTLEGDEVFVAQTIGEYPPFSFVRDNKIVGFEVELAAMFAKSQNKRLEITLNSFAGLLAAASKEEYDFSFTVLTYTPERAEQFYFSNSYYDYNIFLVTSIGNEKLSFLRKVKNSFNSTFVEEQRWKLLLNGFLKTIEITLLSILFGTILGFGIYLLVYASKGCRKVLKVFDYIINGMPVVVLLMIVYYVIFGSSGIPAIAISIGVFSILFTSSVTKSLDVSVRGVSSNQLESALALGYRHPQALFRFVFPQALPNFFKLYKADVLTLLKATAIVGYIAIQDLTKASDIIRSRTYEAIFPLLTLALIYFILAFLLAFLIKHIELEFDPKRRKIKKFMKGVNIDENRS